MNLNIKTFQNFLKNYKNLSIKIKAIINATKAIISTKKMVLLTPSFRNNLNISKNKYNKAGLLNGNLLIYLI